MTTSKRIKIFPADRQQMEDVIASAKDPELKKAYGGNARGIGEALALVVCALAALVVQFMLG